MGPSLLGSMRLLLPLVLLLSAEATTAAAWVRPMPAQRGQGGRGLALPSEQTRRRPLVIMSAQGK